MLILDFIFKVLHVTYHMQSKVQECAHIVLYRNKWKPKAEWSSTVVKIHPKTVSHVFEYVHQSSLWAFCREKSGFTDNADVY